MVKSISPIFNDHFFVQKCFVQLFSANSLRLCFFGERIFFAQKQLLKCWWIWLQSNPDDIRAVHCAGIVIDRNDPFFTNRSCLSFVRSKLDKYHTLKLARFYKLKYVKGYSFLVRFPQTGLRAFPERIFPERIFLKWIFLEFKYLPYSLNMNIPWLPICSLNIPWIFLKWMGY